jgi:hypothetical protein
MISTKVWNRLNEKLWVVREQTIDISWVDYPYTASTCDVMYCRYYGDENLKYYFTPSPAALPS